MCSSCDYKTKDKKALEIHVLAVHEKKKPYKCETCNKYFTQKSARDWHVKRIHEKETLEKKFKCTTCDKFFTFSSELNAHIKCHENKKPPKIYFCKICEKEVSEGKILHIKENHSGGNLKCPKCDRTFDTFNQLGWFECDDICFNFFERLESKITSLSYNFLLVMPRLEAEACRGVGLILRFKG